MSDFRSDRYVFTDRFNEQRPKGYSPDGLYPNYPDQDEQPRPDEKLSDTTE